MRWKVRRISPFLDSYSIEFLLLGADCPPASLPISYSWWVEYLRYATVQSCMCYFSDQTTTCARAAAFFNACIVFHSFAHL